MLPRRWPLNKAIKSVSINKRFRLKGKTAKPPVETVSVKQVVLCQLKSPTSQSKACLPSWLTNNFNRSMRNCRSHGTIWINVHYLTVLTLLKEINRLHLEHRVPCCPIPYSVFVTLGWKLNTMSPKCTTGFLSLSKRSAAPLNGSKKPALKPIKSYSTDMNTLNTNVNLSQLEVSTLNHAEKESPHGTKYKWRQGIILYQKVKRPTSRILVFSPAQWLRQDNKCKLHKIRNYRKLSYWRNNFRS